MQPDPTPAVNAAPVPSKSMFSSRTLAGLALIVIPIFAKHYGFTLDDKLTQDTVEYIFALVGGAGVIFGRWKATRPLHLIAPAAAKTAALLVLVTGFFSGAVLWLPGCATDTGDAAKDRRGRVTNEVLLTVGKFAGKIVLSSAANALTQRAAGLQIDYAEAAQQGLWSNVDTILTSDDLARVVRAYAGPALPGADTALGAQFAAVAPQTAADRHRVIEALAGGMSEATFALRAAHGLEGQGDLGGLRK